MARKIIDFLLLHSFRIMISGFILTSAGIFYFIKMQHTPQERTGFALTIAGLCVWLVGRIGIVAERRRARRMRDMEAKSRSGPET